MVKQWTLVASTLSDVGLDAPSLTLRASPGQGMHIHLARKRDALKIREDGDFVSLMETGSTCTFFHKVSFNLNSHLDGSDSLGAVALVTALCSDQ